MTGAAAIGIAGIASERVGALGIAPDRDGSPPGSRWRRPWGSASTWPDNLVEADVDGGVLRVASPIRRARPLTARPPDPPPVWLRGRTREFVDVAYEADLGPSAEGERRESEFVCGAEPGSAAASRESELESGGRRRCLRP